jgi:hypothetical protein
MLLHHLLPFPSLSSRRSIAFLVVDEAPDVPFFAAGFGGGEEAEDGEVRPEVEGVAGC